MSLPGYTVHDNHDVMGDVNPENYVPPGFQLDDVIDLTPPGDISSGKGKVNYIYQNRDGDVWRVTVGISSVFSASVYGNNKDKGHSQGKECRTEEQMKEAANRISGKLFDINNWP